MLRLFSALLIVAQAGAQVSYFGKNKLQTRAYDFKSYETEHFQILFYSGGEALAEFAARSAEMYYATISRDLGVELEGKTPLLLYLSPGQFGETNVILDILEEGVGGFSELIRNRIVIPFDGSYSNLHHVIGHELVHIFQFQLFYRNRLSALLGAVSEFRIPLWVIEGLAEFMSGWVNQTSEAFMRDLVLNNRLVPLQNLHDGMGYLVYREGESFYHFVAERYGRNRVFEFIHLLRSKRSLDAAFAAAFGMTIERFNAEWSRWLQLKYWPQIGRSVAFDTLARKLTDHVRDGSVYNTAPAISPSGNSVAIVSDRNEYADVYVISTVDGRVLDRVVRGGRSGGFEGMHILRPGVAWSPDERLIALSTTTAGRDNITIVTYPGGRVQRRIYGALDAAYSPRFSADGRRLLFVGLKNGYSDIYETEVVGGEPRRLTYDIYDDRDPAVASDGQLLAFVSDRPDPNDEWRPGAYAVWLRDRDGTLRRISERYATVTSPCFASGDSLLLYAVFDSVGSIVVHSLPENRPVRRAELLGEVSYLTLSRDEKKLTFAYYDNVGWDVCLVTDPLTRLAEDTTASRSVLSDTMRRTSTGLDFSRVRPLGFRLALDYALGAASWSSGSRSGVTGTVYLAASDILGNHRFMFATDITGDIVNSDFYFAYWLLPYRVDYGFGLFQQRGYAYYLNNLTVVDPIARGVTTIAAYPFDRFLRAELGLTGYVVHEDTWVLRRDEGYELLGAGNVLTSYASPGLVFDNTLWTVEGPARGVRARLAGDLSLFGAKRFWEPYADLRSYLRLGRRYTLASRLAAAAGLGPDGSRYTMGGEYVRGYNWYEFVDNPGPLLSIASLELRYPFIERLKLGFPLPIEIGGIRGVAFADAGLVVNDSVHVWQGGRLKDLKVGLGFGLRVQISYFALKLDWAKPVSSTADPGWKVALGLGSDF